MSDPVNELAQLGLALSPADRSRLVDLLLESLNESSTTEVQAAWNLEIEQRLVAHDRGEVMSIPGDDVFAKARKIAR